MKKVFGFVVLNYINYSESIACVESILNISGKNYFIVIVDNDSPNGSFEVLFEKFEQHPNIRVISSGRNGGYSYGNNCGIKFLQSLGIFDVIIATSDTIVESKDILQRLENLDFLNLGIVGPKVTNLDGDDQNPMLKIMGLGYVLNIHFPFFVSFLRKAICNFFPSLMEKNQKQKNSGMKDNQGGDVYMIHGCFLYLTSHYIKKCGFLDESLFMYGEEDLLAFNCMQNNLRVLYEPSIKVIHKEARSTPKNHITFDTKSKRSIKHLIQAGVTPETASFFSVNSNNSMRNLRKKMSLHSLLFKTLRN